MAGSTVPPQHDAALVAALLDLPEVVALVREMDHARETGRPGYGTRAMVGAALVKSVYGFATWSRTCRLIREHAALREAVGGAPSQDAAYRFAKKLRATGDPLARCLDRLVGGLRESLPGYGESVAIDGSDLPAYANGQRYVSKRSKVERARYSDPDATWGHRSSVSTRSGGGFYGYKVHAAVCTTTALPVAWHVATAKDSEPQYVPTLLDSAARGGVVPTVAVLDRGYDSGPLYDLLSERGVRPVIPLTESTRVKRGEHLPPSCEHGTWTFHGADARNGRTKWLCPTGECSPRSRWVKADRLHTLIPRSTPRWKALYRQRGAVERTFGRVKHEWGGLPLRVRQIGRVRLHVDLTLLAVLGSALIKARALPAAA